MAAETLPFEPDQASSYRAIGRALRYLVEHAEDQPSLDDAASAAGLSPFHFQRLFTRWAGVSPKRFGQFVTLGRAKTMLDEQASLLDTALEVGLSGPGRLHDLFVTWEAMTPGDYKAAGAGLTIRWGVQDSPFGPALIGLTERGLCWLAFLGEAGTGRALAEMAGQYPAARLVEDPGAVAEAAARAFALQGAPGPLPVLLRGTPFQLKVWEALLRIPPGSCTSYGALAREIGSPQAGRAVGAAVGRNPVSWLIPCHRVILQSGAVHNYRWGAGTKRAMLALEAARRA
ncbi:methylated-DNA--[protein]-cysteine S-methyltransferase [Arenibaculum pallidiluteum]|uniref:methylated-DNA--[protein]-cysteine S-methyltransferase n=1 Tax=Arenibaculum pallidiluteum TaxID=2812559 RepID=UPI001A964FEB|nr:methylated-DNA--[protein]-cysteine S-methyltransferase [Arenibaculum pallidiluteum]